MSVLVHKLRSGHEEVFGDNRPRSHYLINMKLFDYWGMHPLRPELSSMFESRSEKDKIKFRNKYVEEIEFEGMEGIAPPPHFEENAHRSWKLVRYLQRDGIMKVPCYIFIGHRQDGRGYIYEGHHRTGAASVLKWKTIPALVLNTVDSAPGENGMTLEDRKEHREELLKRGLPDSSRIHGMRIHGWSEKELRTFMTPRPKDKSKYHMQSNFISECALGHPGWEGIPIGSISINIKRGKFELPWKIEQEY